MRRTLLLVALAACAPVVRSDAPESAADLLVYVLNSAPSDAQVYFHINDQIYPMRETVAAHAGRRVVRLDYPPPHRLRIEVRLLSGTGRWVSDRLHWVGPGDCIDLSLEMNTLRGRLEGFVTRCPPGRRSSNAALDT